MQRVEFLNLAVLGVFFENALFKSFGSFVVDKEPCWKCLPTRESFEAMKETLPIIHYSNIHQEMVSFYLT